MFRWSVLHGTLCKQPRLYRSIVVKDPTVYFDAHIYQPCEDLIKEALDRSCGQTVEFSSGSMINLTILLNLVGQAKTLKSLKIQGNRAAYTLPKIVQGFPQLERLEVRRVSLYHVNGHTETPLIEEVGRSCQKLNYFRLNTAPPWDYARPRKLILTRMRFILKSICPSYSVFIWNIAGSPVRDCRPFSKVAPALNILLFKNAQISLSNGICSRPAISQESEM